MTKNFIELQKESSRFLSFLKEQHINAYVDKNSYRDYHVKIKNIYKSTIILYHKPSKDSFSIGTHEIAEEQIKIKIEELWYQFQYPNATKIKGLCAYVDGSFYKGHIGWGLVIVQDNTILEEKGGVLTISADNGSNQIAGEVQGVLEAVEYALNQNIMEINIYYDYIGLEKWATGKWKARSAIGQYYIAKMMQHKVKIHWHKVKAHSGNPFNEKADKLAKKYIDNL